MLRFDKAWDADALLARILTLREALRAGRLTAHQVASYQDLGRRVDEINRHMDQACDAEVAERLWVNGAELIRSFLDAHFEPPVH
jgi:hypothetical protein